jgi:pimeloyl-ACP methyl ester carboxylesterase
MSHQGGSVQSLSASDQRGGARLYGGREDSIGGSRTVPTVTRDRVSIYYEEHGSGYPLLLLAPGGLNSAIAFWDRMPFNPIEAFSGDFHVIAMDQRNAGRSTGPVEPAYPWAMYATDQLALLDALGIERVLAIGCCIGCSFVLKLVEQAPDRIVAGVLMQPTGLDPIDPDSHGPYLWTEWGQDLIASGAATDMATIDAFGYGLFGSEFVFSVPRDFVATIRTPMLLLDGNDRTHPKRVSAELAESLQDVERIERWKDHRSAAAAQERMRSFLHAHVPTDG